jgi:hypothetical protein
MSSREFPSKSQGSFHEGAAGGIVPFILPLELRNSIYEHSLVFSYRVRPFLKQDFRSSARYRQYREPPFLGLLSGSKAIREECLPILIGSNTWYLPNRAVNFPTTISTIELSRTRTIFSAYGHLFRSVILALPHYHHKKYLAAMAPQYMITGTGDSRCFLGDAILENIIADWHF